MEFRDSMACKAAGITYHLALVEEWQAQQSHAQYAPAAFAGDGFIHCTDGLDLLTDIANMFYKDSPDQRTVLVLDRSRIEAETRYDDPEERFPHIYGKLNTSAVIGELPVQRDHDGSFTHLGSQKL